MKKFLYHLTIHLTTFCLFWGGIETLSRTRWVESTLVYPSYNLHYANRFELELFYLQNFYEKHGQIDCLFIGSSMMMSNISPAIVEEGYFAQSGEKIHCFNLHGPGFPLQIISTLADFVVETYHPKVVFIEINHRAFFQRPPQEINPIDGVWLEYIRGNFTGGGWLTQHSQAYRYYLRYRRWAFPQLADELASAATASQYLYPDGTSLLFKPPQNVRAKVSAEDRVDQGFIRLHQTPELAAADVAGLVHALELQGQTQIIALESPLPTSYMDYYPDGRAGWEKFIQQITDTTTHYQVPFWVVNDKIAIPTEFWGNRNHTNTNGGKLFSYWVGTQLALAEAQDFQSLEVPSPTLALRPIEDFFDTPWGLPSAVAQEYANLLPVLPDEAVLLHLSEENPHYFATNIALYIGVEGREIGDLRLLWLLEHAQPQTPIEDLALATDGADYVLISEFWLNNQSIAYQTEFADPTRYALIETLTHPALPIAYRLYKVIAP